MEAPAVGAGARLSFLVDQMLFLPWDDGGIHSAAELARRLVVGEGLSSAMTADLARRGHLAPLDTGCDGCGLAKTCAPASDNAPALMLTAKGRGAL